MRLAKRWIVIMVVAFALVTALHADDAADRAATAKKDKLTVSNSAPAVPLEVRLDAANSQPAAFSTLFAPLANDSLQPAAPALPAPARRWLGASDHYTPRVEWFLGYSFWRAMPTSMDNRMSYLHGGSTSVAFNLNRYFGLVADFGGYGTTRLTTLSPTGDVTVDASGSAYTYTFGPRFSYRRYERFTPFVQALFGGVYATPVTISGCTGSPACTPIASDNAFAAMFGLGFDIKLSRHFALRPFEGDFLLTNFRNAFSANGQTRGWQDNARFSAGIVFRFGGNPAPAPAPVASAPVTATCSADREMVYVGSGDLVAVRAVASDPENGSLTYSWSANEGAVDGSGSEVHWNSVDRRPGAYTVTVHVYNSRNGSAECSANIRVEMRPNRPPTMVCAADHNTVTVGDAVQITATASDPDDDKLSFSWNASGGRMEGTGSTVQFQTTGLQPGSYAITGRVDDGRTGRAECTVNVAAQAPPPPPEVAQLESRLALHSIYFATARPAIAAPAGGLVDSQQQVLLSLAADFNRYLTFKPQAHVILEGHADRRGSVEYNQSLTERRVERTKGFLIEHGVPAANIETRAVGKQDNLDATQVKKLVDQNPDLTDEDRRKIDGNLLVIVMANNRRVDVSLNTTGQQSSRQYPFNAKDSMTLLSTSGGKTEKQAAPAARK